MDMQYHMVRYALNTKSLIYIVLNIQLVSKHSKLYYKLCGCYPNMFSDIRLSRYWQLNNWTPCNSPFLTEIFRLILLKYLTIMEKLEKA